MSKTLQEHDRSHHQLGSWGHSGICAYCGRGDKSGETFGTAKWDLVTEHNGKRRVIALCAKHAARHRR